MSPLRFLRLALAFASVSAVVVATACGGSTDEGGGGESCNLAMPSCGSITNCDGSTTFLNATCGSDGWSCPPVPDLACPTDGGINVCESAIALDCGTCNGQPVAQECGPTGWSCPPIAPSCGESDGGACPDIAPLCIGCDGTGTFPTCSGSEWICPIFNCPIEVDAGDDDGGSCQGWHCAKDAGAHDGGGFDAGSDASSDGGGHDAGVGDVCAQGADCVEGMSCTIASAGQVPLSCECIDGAYSCVP